MTKGPYGLGDDLPNPETVAAIDGVRQVAERTRARAQTELGAPHVAVFAVIAAHTEIVAASGAVAERVAKILLADTDEPALQAIHMAQPIVIEDVTTDQHWRDSNTSASSLVAGYRLAR